MTAVSDVDLTVNAGEIHCLIGPNGAGKSTLFKLIVGLYPPSQGSILFDTVDITTERPYARVQRGMSIKMQAPSVFKELPVRQNIQTALQDDCPALNASPRRIACRRCSTSGRTAISSRVSCRMASSNGSRSGWRWR